MGTNPDNANLNTQPNASDALEPVRVPPITTPAPQKGTAFTRNILAYVLVGSFFLIAAMPLFAIFGDPTESDMTVKTTNAVDWLKGVSAYLAGLVGAVLGYYYRAESRGDSQ